ncbi:cytochrome P450 [Coprinellus micaceus]|uniref:Cytochrome P450 n=1 Tax=Coprinellus micaceus TaxID=71717 RepID=A0A4Y7T4B6_COPMI|nr:cytochrome P450 [Coprinellus micaceus]
MNFIEIDTCVLGLAIPWAVAITLYRLYLHPLSAFPGPALAGATGWYETYYEVYKRGKMVEKLEALHKRYGPVVRMGPNKLHFSDVAAYDAIYTNRDFRKTSQFYDVFLASEASFGTVDNKFAKARRDLLRSFFSRKGVLKLENVIQDTIDRLIISLANKVGSPKPLDLHRVFSCITMEVISAYCFAKHYDAINYPDYAYPVALALHMSNRMGCVAQHFPIVLDALFSLPDWLVRFVSPDALAFPDFRGTRHLFHHMLNPKSGQEVPSEKSLKQEAAVLIAAGTETTANACAHAVFHVLTNPHVKERLKKELVEAWPDVEAPISLERLEKLPYLSAVAHEALRFSHGVTAVLPRAVPEATEIASNLAYRNADIFPDPLTFRPERWIEKGSSDLVNYLVPFSKGPRKVDLEIVDTTLQDLSDFEAYVLPIQQIPVKACVKRVEGVSHLLGNA